MADPADKKIIVLGAGASIGAAKYPKESSWKESVSEMPSADNFFYDLFHLKETETRGERFLNFLGLTYEGVNDFLVRAWGLKKNIDRFDPEEWRNINVEDVFTFLDVGEKMLNKGTSYHNAFLKSKKFLEDFIGIMLSLRCEGQYCEHLYRIFSNLNPEDDIISFNWDTIADFTLERVQSAQYKNYLRIMAEDKVYIREYVKRGLFLKLHGSLNWICCKNRDCVDFGRPRLALRKRGKNLEDLFSGCFDKCPTCNTENPKRFIVPPISNKLIDKDTFLRKIWLLAREKLTRVGCIVLIGYSFPKTDFYTEWLFRQIYFLEGKTPEIVVVNPAMFKRGSEVSKRYRNIFGGFKITRYRDLAEYASNC